MLTIIVILLEIVAPIIIVMGVYNNNLKELAAYSSLGLFAFTFLATLLYHYPPKGIEFYFFLKNITIMGGLLSLYLNFQVNRPFLKSVRRAADPCSHAANLF